MYTKGFVPIKLGLLTGEHRLKMGDSIWLFAKFCSYMGKYRDTLDPIQHEICVQIFPKTVAKELDFSWEDMLKHTANLVKTGYIELHDISEKEDSPRWVICIKKAIEMHKKNSA